MKVVWTALWAFLLSCMAAYVIGNMTGGGFQFSHALVLTVVFTIAVVILGEGIIKEEEA